MAMKWYVVHTYSGYESRAKAALEERIRTGGMEEAFEEILIPTEAPTETPGKRRGVGKKFFPGYMLVKMELNDETWHLLKGTPKVTGFVGGTTNPPSIPDEEVDLLQKAAPPGLTRLALVPGGAHSDLTRFAPYREALHGFLSEQLAPGAGERPTLSGRGEATR